MSTRATGTFDVDSWEQEPYDDRDGVQLARARVTKTFHGQIDAQSTAELLLAGAQAYVGLERIVGRIHDRSGSFVLQHSASQSGGAQTASWSIVPESGTGELLGLRGEARIVVEPDGGHTFTLDYDLDS
jgi:Protein of unknown function (DUF3224)